MLVVHTSTTLRCNSDFEGLLYCECRCRVIEELQLWKHHATSLRGHPLSSTTAPALESTASAAAAATVAAHEHPSSAAASSSGQALQIYAAPHVPETDWKQLCLHRAASARWKLGRLHCTAALAGHKASVTGLAVVDDVILSGSTDATARLWQVNGCSGHTQLLHVLRHPGPVVAVALASRAVAVTATSQNAYFWKAGKCVKKCEADQAACVTCLTCADTHTVIGCSNGTLHVIDTYSKALQLIIRAHNSQITSLLVVNDVTISNDDVIIAGAQSGEVLGYSLATGEKLWQQHTVPAAAVIGLQYEPARHAVYALNNRSQVWELPWQESSAYGKQKIKHHLLADVHEVRHSTSFVVPRYGRDRMFVAGWGVAPCWKDNMVCSVDFDTDETGTRCKKGWRVFVAQQTYLQHTLDTSSCKQEGTGEVQSSRLRTASAAPGVPSVRGAGLESGCGSLVRVSSPLGEHMQQPNTAAAAAAAAVAVAAAAVPDGRATRSTAAAEAATSAFVSDSRDLHKPSAVDRLGVRTRAAAAAGANADNSNMATEHPRKRLKVTLAGPLTSQSQPLQQPSGNAILAMCMTDSGALVIGRADGMLHMFRMRCSDHRFDGGFRWYDYE
eukprot:jgi/Chrzof1/3723/Cz13g06170.t1